MAKKSDQYVISAAILVHEARQRVNSGEAGRGVKWGTWAAENINWLPDQRRVVLVLRPDH